MTLDADPPFDRALLDRIERVAVELAQLGGTEIVSTLGGLLAVRYKSSVGDADAALLRDPVSEVDARVEAMIRERVAEHFPGHDVIGEEMDDRPGRGHDFVWAIDPIDGTTNFINGFPLFASSVGVLYRGRPVVGALWCSTSHALHAGVYHAGAGPGLRFDGLPVSGGFNPAVRRRLAGEPEARHTIGVPWESRKTGSAAIECAFVAAGLLRVARFDSPHLWDVAGGMALVRAAGLSASQRTDGRWETFDSFDSPDDLRDWQRGVMIGDEEAIAAMTKSMQS
jgi:myo-inositol-1(or 4)-monophosphatase